MMTRPPTLLFNLLLAPLLGTAPLHFQASVVDRNGAPLPSATLHMAATLADKNARLSIDAGLQKIVEEELALHQPDLKAKKIIAILADPKTG